MASVLFFWLFWKIALLDLKLKYLQVRYHCHCSENSLVLSVHAPVQGIELQMDRIALLALLSHRNLHQLGCYNQCRWI